MQKNIFGRLNSLTIHPLRMYLLEEELVWAKRGLEQIVSALDNNQNNVKKAILWG